MTFGFVHVHDSSISHEKEKGSGIRHEASQGTKASREYGDTRTPKGWKEWICPKTMGGITEKWLTRAENLGKILPPAI